MHGPETRVSLIERLRGPASEDAWLEFTRLYRPLIYRVARGRGLQHADADDMTQDVLSIVRRRVRDFDPNADGAFRGWLFTITRNLCINFLTRQHGPQASGDTQVLHLLAQHPGAAPASELFELEYQRMMFRQAAAAVRSEFTADTWEAFWQTAVRQRPLQEVADTLNKTNGAIRVARCRVLARIQQYIQHIEDVES